MKYAESASGLVHLISANDCERTICGDAQDGEETSWTPVEHGPVTCPMCSAEIINCQGVEIRGIRL